MLLMMLLLIQNLLVITVLTPPITLSTLGQVHTPLLTLVMHTPLLTLVMHTPLLTLVMHTPLLLLGMVTMMLLLIQNLTVTILAPVAAMLYLTLAMPQLMMAPWTMLSLIPSLLATTQLMLAWMTAVAMPRPL